jgi:hypothetical protein
MKLPIKKEYFDKIKSGEKTAEFRDAHITFVCEETGETLRKEVISVNIVNRLDLPEELQESGLFDDDEILCFGLEWK